MSVVKDDGILHVVFNSGFTFVFLFVGLVTQDKAVRMVAAEVLLRELTTSISDEDLTKLFVIIEPHQHRWKIHTSRVKAFLYLVSIHMRC